MPGRESPFVRFRPFEANVAARELRKNGTRLKLQDQPFRVLEALLEKPGEVVTREELQERIWGEDTYVDFDKSLSAAVNKVRQALGDSRTRPRYIETIPKVGYRFVGSVDEAAAQSEPNPTQLQGKRSRLWVIWAGAAALLTALLIVGFVVWNRSTQQPQAPVIASSPVQLTSYPGEERQPAFSPDGNQVVFTRRERDREDYDIWVKLVGEEKALQLTFTPADETSPAWSPDGSQIAFLRHKAGGLADVVLISPHGDAERTLTEIYSRSNIPSTLAWSPDASRLLTFQRFDSGGARGLFTVSVASGVIDRLLDADARTPSYSPDGKRIAFLLGLSVPELALLPSAGGAVERLGYRVRNDGRAPIPWTPDGLGLVEGRPLSIFPLSQGEPALLPLVGGNAIEPAISASSGRFAYTAQSFRMTTWLLDTGRRDAVPRELAPSSRTNGNPQFSHDGREVVFSSNRSGELAVWVANLDGSNLRRLTDVPVGGTPRWSPDGAEVVFDGPGGTGVSEIFAVPSFGGAPRRITNGPTNDNVPSYSNDGRWVYFASNRSGEWQTYRVAVEGEERRPDSVRQMTQGGGYAAFESPDGRYLYYAKQRILAVGEPNSLWRVPLEGGAEEVVIEDLYSSWSNWALAGDSVYFLNPGDETEDPQNARSWAIYELNLTTRERTRITAIQGPPFAGPSFDVSHDERWILYSTVDPPESDLMLVEGFR